MRMIKRTVFTKKFYKDPYVIPSFFMSFILDTLKPFSACVVLSLPKINEIKYISTDMDVNKTLSSCSFVEKINKKNLDASSFIKIYGFSSLEFTIQTLFFYITNLVVALLNIA